MECFGAPRDDGEKKTMQLTWADEHSQALRELLAKRLSFSEIAKAINARFNTDYSRNATIGRATRMGLSAPDRPEKPVRPKRQRKQHALQQPKQRARVSEFQTLRPVFERAAALKLRCVGLSPRHLSVTELEADDCRYPYGGDRDGEAITFCGHPKREGSSYCVSHFHLTRGPGITSERAAGQVTLRLVEAA